MSRSSSQGINPECLIAPMHPPPQRKNFKLCLSQNDLNFEIKSMFFFCSSLSFDLEKLYFFKFVLLLKSLLANLKIPTKLPSPYDICNRK